MRLCTVLTVIVPPGGGGGGGGRVHLHYEQYGYVLQVWVSFLMKNYLIEVCILRENSLNGLLLLAKTP